MAFFLIPMETVSRDGENVRQEKYIPALGVSRQIVPIGDTAICWADCTAAQATAIAANADVLLVPPLDNTISNVTAVRNQIEAMNIPAQWVTAGMTYRTVMRVVVGMAQLIQAVRGRGVTVTLAGNLNMTLSQLSVATRNAIAASCDALSIDRTGIIGSTTLREALRMFGQQFATGRGVRLGDL